MLQAQVHDIFLTLLSPKTVLDACYYDGDIAFWLLLIASSCLVTRVTIEARPFFFPRFLILRSLRNVHPNKPIWRKKKKKKSRCRMNNPMAMASAHDLKKHAQNLTYSIPHDAGLLQGAPSARNHFSDEKALYLHRSTRREKLLLNTQKNVGIMPFLCRVAKFGFCFPTPWSWFWS